MQLFPGPQESLLGQILRILAMPRECEEEGEYPAMVAMDQCSECR